MHIDIHLAMCLPPFVSGACALTLFFAVYRFIIVSKLNCVNWCCSTLLSQFIIQNETKRTKSAEQRYRNCGMPNGLLSRLNWYNWITAKWIGDGEAALKNNPYGSHLIKLLTIFPMLSFHCWCCLSFESIQNSNWLFETQINFNFIKIIRIIYGNMF